MCDMRRTILARKLHRVLRSVRANRLAFRARLKIARNIFSFARKSSYVFHISEKGQAISEAYISRLEGKLDGGLKNIA